MAKPDYYEILGLGQDANLKQIKSAFRREALRWHPDRNPEDPDAERRFKAAAEAYEILRDPERRSLYDSGRRSNLMVTVYPGSGRRGKRGRGCGQGGDRRCAWRSYRGW